MEDWLHKCYAGDDGVLESLFDWVNRVGPCKEDSTMALRLRFAQA